MVFKKEHKSIKNTKKMAVGEKKHREFGRGPEPKFSYIKQRQKIIIRIINKFYYSLTMNRHASQNYF